MPRPDRPPPPAPPSRRVAVALWSGLYGEAPPAGMGTEAILEALIAVVGPLAYDAFYVAYLEETDPAPPIPRRRPGPARVRALDLALREMLRSCPPSQDLRDFIEGLEDDPAPDGA